MKKSLLCVPFAIIIFMGNFLFAQTNKTVNVTEAGTLHTLFTDEEKATIDSLILTGNLDARDFRFIRDSLIVLSILDIRGITIAEYEGTEGTLYGENYSYPANTFPAYAFYRSYIRQRLTFEGLSFIPDGGKLNGVEACYETAVTATAFGDARIQSKNDILSVGVRMEHSALGDLRIKLQCPNGQSAFLKGMTWNNIAQIPFINPNNIFMAGIPYGGSMWPHVFDDISDYSNPDKNPAGIPWQYCWAISENNMGVNNKGVMDTNDLRPNYRLDTVTYDDPNYEPIPHRVLDSSDYEAGSGFFVPSDDFQALVGCPINGEWSLIICDDIVLDNGYVSEWYIELLYKNSREADDLFESKNSLVSIYLPSNINTIGKYAFYGCTGLENITISASNPPAIEENAFSGIENLSEINLFVTEETFIEYSSADVWKDFSVSTGGTSSLKEVNTTNSDIKVYPNPTTGKLQIEGLSHLNEVKVYNILGELIISIKNQSSFDISSYPDGIYFIKAGDSISKIIKQSK